MDPSQSQARAMDDATSDFLSRRNNMAWYRLAENEIHAMAQKAINNKKQSRGKATYPAWSLGKESYFVDLLASESRSSRLDVIRHLIQEFTFWDGQKAIQTQDSIMRLWLQVHDLLQDGQPEEDQTLGLLFLCSMLNSNGKSTLSDEFRLMVFQVARRCYDGQHGQLVLEVVIMLTKDGRDITYLDEVLGDLLLDFFSVCVKFSCLDQLLKLVGNLIEYHFDELNNQSSMRDFISCVCHTCSMNFEPTDISGCLSLIKTLITTNNVQPEFLGAILGGICRVVIEPTFSGTCVTLLELLVNSPYRGPVTISAICKILRDPRFQTSINLLRGAVFLLSKACWGDMILPDGLRLEPISILPAFCVAARMQLEDVSLEIVNELQNLIKRQGKDLGSAVWLIIIQTLTSCLPLCTNNMDLADSTGNLLIHLEELVKLDIYDGEKEMLFSLIESYPGDHDMAAAIDYRSSTVHPSVTGWMSNLIKLIQRYLLEDSRSQYQICAIGILSNTMDESRFLYEEQLIELVILKYLNKMHDNLSVEVQNAVVSLVAKVAGRCQATFYDKLCDVMSKPLHSGSMAVAVELHIVEQLKQLFIKRLNSNSPKFSLRPLSILMGFVRQKLVATQDQNNVAIISSSVMAAIRILCSIRWTALGHVKFIGEIHVTSPFIRIVPSQTADSLLSAMVNKERRGTDPKFEDIDVDDFTSVESAFHAMFTIFCSILKAPVAWPAVHEVISCLKDILTTSSYEVPAIVDVSMVCRSVVALVSKGMGTMPTASQIVSPMRHAGAGAPMITNCVTVDSESKTFGIRSAVFKDSFDILAALLVYKRWLIPSIRDSLGNCLQDSLHQHLNSCIRVLGAYIMELKTVRALSKIITTMLKFKSNVKVRLPFLEFLSILGRMPDVEKFLSDQDYKSVFAIILESVKGESSSYLKALAYHVIAVWFLHLRVKDRRKYVQLITRELVASSKDKMRQSRMKEPSLSAPAVGSPSDQMSMSEPAKSLFFQLDPMAETCLDMMARYAYSNDRENTSRKEQPAVSALLKSAKRKTWAYGHTLVSVAATADGWGQVTVRKSTGTISWVSRLLNTGEFPRRSIHWCHATTECSTSPLEIGTSLDIADTVKNQLEESFSRFKVLAGKLSPSKDTGDVALPPRKSSLSAANTEKSAEPKPSVQFETPDLTGDEHSEDTPSSKSQSLVKQKSIKIQNAEKHENESDTGSSKTPSVTDFKVAPKNIVSSKLSSITSSTVVPEENMLVQEGPAMNVSVLLGAQPTYQHSQPLAIVGNRRRNIRHRQSDTKFGYESEESVSSNPSSYQEHLMLTGLISESTSERDHCQRTFDNISNAARKKVQRGRRKNISKVKEPRTAKDTPSAMEKLPINELIPEKIVADTNNPKKDRGRAGSSSSDCEPLFSPSEVAASLDSLNSNTTFSPTDHDNTDSPYPVSSVASSYSQAGSSIAGSFDPLGEKSNFDALDIRPVHASLKTSKGSPLVTRVRSKTYGDISASSPPKPQNLNNLIESEGKGGLRRTSSLSLKDRPKRRVEQSSGLSKDSNTNSGSDPLKDLTLPDLNSDQSSFLFLQMHHMPYFSDRAIPLTENGDNGGDLNRMLRVLDQKPSYHTHRIGVVYIGENQSNADDIFRNECGSPRYVEFLTCLGDLMLLKDLSSEYSGGLDTSDSRDGDFAYVWQGDVTHVVFQVATLMPNDPKDPKSRNKRMHIDNNLVTIIYNDSGLDFDRSWFGNAVNFAYIIVSPLGENAYRIGMIKRDELKSTITDAEDRIVSPESVGTYCRMLAIHASLASNLQRNINGSWEERLRMLKNIVSRHGKPCVSQDESIDFTCFT